MKKYIIFIFFVIAVYNSSYSQILTILNSEDKTPVQNVYVECESNIQISDINGKVDITGFSEDCNIKIYHPFFNVVETTKSEIVKNGLIVIIDSKWFDLSQITISANKWEQNREEVPLAIQYIKYEDAVFQNPQTVADLLGNTNLIFIQKSQYGGGSPMLRGFSANSVLIVVDGVRMNNAIYRSGNLQNVISLDANSLEAAEVILGPGSVIYGSDALGGVMDFHTLSPKLSSTDKILFTANVFSRYSTASKEKTGHIDFNVGTKKISLLSSFTFSDFDDLKMGSEGNDEYARLEYVDFIDNKDSIVQNEDINIQKFTGYSQINIMQKIRFKPNTKLDFNYIFHYSELSDVPRYDRLIQYSSGSLKYGDWYYGPQKWMMHEFDAEYISNNLIFDRMKFIAAYQDYTESRHDRKFGKDAINERFENVDIYSVNIDFDKELWTKSSLYYGVEALYNKLNSTAYSRDIYSGETEPISTRYPDGSDYKNFATYAQFKSNLTERMTFNFGGRYSYIMLNAEFDTTFFDFPFTEASLKKGAFSGSTGITYRIKKFQFNMNLASGFRAPNIDDIGKVFDSEPGSVVVPNPELLPEYVYSAELGLIKRGENLHFEIGGFYSYLDNAMVRRDFTFNGQDSIMYDGTMSKVQAYVNTDNAIIYGAQGTVAFDFFNFELKSSLSYTSGHDKEGYTLRYAPPIFGATHLIYDADNLSVDLNYVYNGENSYEKMTPTEIAKPEIYATDSDGNPYCPAWQTLNFKLGYEFSFANKNVFDIYFGVENILDVRYRPYSSGIVSAGRNFILSLKYNFDSTK